MPIATLDSFLLATDATLLVEFSGSYTLLHDTDLEADDPIDTVLYLGSLLTSRILRAQSSPGVDEVQISVIDTLPVWLPETVYAVGDSVQPTIDNTYRYRVVQAGTSDDTEPTWSVGGIGSTTADGTVLWELQAKKHTIEEVTLALTEAELDTSIAGDPLYIQSVIAGGVVNAIPIYIRFDNAVQTVANTGVIPDISLAINAVVETEV